MDTQAWLSFIREETETALTLLYSYIAFHEALASQETVDLINQNSDFWRVYEGSVLRTLFIYLGRLTDDARDGKSFADFKKHCYTHLEDFTKESFLSRRKEALELNPNYLDDAEFFEEKDFTDLFTRLRPHEAYLRAEAKQIRSKVYAHAIITDAAQQASLFQSINLYVLEEALTNYWIVGECINQAFTNVRRADPTDQEFPEKEGIMKGFKSILEGAI